MNTTQDILQDVYFTDVLHPENRVYTCKAWFKNFNGVLILRSYNTVVAYIKNNICYVYGFYSNTTQQHIRKFCQLHKAKGIKYLYQRSDKKEFIEL